MAGDELEKPRHRKWLLGGIKVLIAVVLIAILVKSDRLQLDALLDVQERWGALVLAQVCYLGQLLLSFVRWQILLRAFGIVARFSEVLRLGWIGLLFNQVIPGATGGDVVKGIYIARETPGRRAEAILTILIDRFVGLTGMILIGALVVAIYFDRIYSMEELRGFIWFLPLLLVGVVTGAFLLTWRNLWHFAPIRAVMSRLPERLRSLLERVADALYQLRKRPAMVTGILGMSFLGHVLGIAMHYFLAVALVGAVSDLGLFLFVDPMGQFINAIPLTPGGVGLGENAYDVLFRGAGSEVPGAPLMVLIRISWLFWGAFGIIFYLRGRKELEAAAELVDSTEEELLHGATPGDDNGKSANDNNADDTAAAATESPAGGAQSV